MWKLAKRFTFEAAHKLPNHDGKCRRLHGHSWVAVIHVSGDTLQGDGPKRGMVLDFADIKIAMEPLLVAYLDHHYLNETLGMVDPTSEHIAHWLYQQLHGRVPGLTAVTINETCTCACTYSGSEGGSE